MQVLDEIPLLLGRKVKIIDPFDQLAESPLERPEGMALDRTGMLVELAEAVARHTVVQNGRLTWHEPAPQNL
mgnify:FL=1